MAADESLLDTDDERIVKGFIKLQGQIRGLLMRKALLEIQKDFEEIVADIEGDMTVQWPSKALGLPTVRKRQCTQTHGASWNKHNKPGRKDKQTHHLTEQEEGSVARDDPCLSVPSDQCNSLHVNNNLLFCDNEKADSFKVTEIVSKCETPVEYLSCQDIPPGSHENATGHMKSNICVSKEVQTDIMVETMNDLTEPERLKDSALKQYPHINSYTVLPKPSKLPNMSPDWERTNAEGERQDDTEFQCPSNDELLCQPVSTSLSNEIEPGIKHIGLKEVIDSVPFSVESEIEEKHQRVRDCAEVESQADFVRSFEGTRDDAKKPDSGESKAVLEQGTDDRVESNAATSLFDLPTEKDELLKLKSTLAMELLWIEQAINSRKNYLRLKHQLS